MNFELNEHQRMLKHSLQRLCDDHFPTNGKMLGTDVSSAWSALAELGFLGAAFSEEDGGLGWGPVETMIGAEVLGAAQADIPWWTSGVLAANALKYGAPEIRRRFAGGLARGLVYAFVEPDIPLSTDGPGHVEESISGAYRLNGSAMAITHGDIAARLIVAISTHGHSCVVDLDASAPGVDRRPFRTFDGRSACDFTFNQVAVRDEAIIAFGPDALALIERVKQHAVAALAAEAVGLMQSVLDLSVEHLKTRRQFGAPLASFQSLQHRAADMLIACEQARSMAMYAAMVVESADPDERRKAIAAVRSVTAVAARFVGQSSVQLHGGVGVTEVHPAGRAFKRLTMIEYLLNGEGAQRELANVGGLISPSDVREGV